MTNKLLKPLMILWLAGLLAACFTNQDGFGLTPAATGAAGADSMLLLVSSPQLASSGVEDVTVTAIVKDANNVVLADVPVVFSANSGTLLVVSGITDANGQAIATLGQGGDYTNRTITVTAVAGSITKTVTVDVTGTSLSISGDSSATIGDVVPLTILLTDSNGEAIANKTVTVSSSLSNTLSAVSLTTDTSGQVSVDVTADNGGTDTITATAQGVTATHSLVISNDTFNISTPAEDADVVIGVVETVTVHWETSGVPQSGKTVAFTATRGTLSATSAVTNGSGDATVTVTSNNAGPAKLTASVSGGPSTTRNINFVATVADTIELQVDKTTIGPNDGSQAVTQQAFVTATVRDPANNLVKGKLIRFSFDPTDQSNGGTLTTASATTDSLGKATTAFVSSAATTAKDGVVIKAVVDDTPAVLGTVSLTVAQSALFVRLGTGRAISEVGSTAYAYPFSVIVTDASGIAVEGAEVALSLTPLEYDKGIWVAGVDTWSTTVSTSPSCPSEDTNQNGIVDAGEDTNGNGTLEPGNIASVPTTVTTDTNGIFEFNVVYPKDYGQWVKVRLEAADQVSGTEAVDTVDFVLNVLANDINDVEAAPPGVLVPGIDPSTGALLGGNVYASPFGQRDDCAEPL